MLEKARNLSIFINNLNHSLPSPGEAPPVLVLPRRQGAGVGHGVHHPLHQGHRGPRRQRGAASGAQEWAGEVLDIFFKTRKSFFF